MNIYTKQIAEYLEIPMNFALEVQDIMDREIDIDLSECTEHEFKQCVRAAFCIWVNDVDETIG